MDKDVLLRLWGKTNRPQITTYHPLLFHLLDVAHCAAELWQLLPQTIRKRLSVAVHLDEATAGTFFVLLAGLHDLGKAYPNFQKKAPQFLAALENAGFDFPDNTGNPPHNFVSVPEVERLLAECKLFPNPLPNEVSVALTRILGAHHGVFPRSEDLNDYKISARTLGKNPQWQQARNELAEILLNALEDSRHSAPPASLIELSDIAFVPLLAAYISLADWFGSSRYFPMNGAQDITAYTCASRRQAAEALKGSGWTVPVEIKDERDFSSLFRYLRPDDPVEPNELQKTVGELLKAVNSPSLWIIEQEMGAGKTEAAFSIFDTCRVKGLAHGTYIAMPTQATSNAMFDRLGDFLTNGRGEKHVNLILAHSHAYLDKDYRELMNRANDFSAPVYNEADQDASEEGTLLVRSWFTARKQTLLAHYGVGTIDQSLLGVLQTRHWFVRLFGLAGKVVIFDEVHAYDTYMNTLLVRLIEWLAELDCTVVLLSATLPQRTRLALANAYRKGAKAALEAQPDPPQYPRITLIQKGQDSADDETTRAFPIPPKPNSESKTVALCHLPNTPEAVRTALLDAIPGDGCAIIICNTVARAQEMFEALREKLEPHGWNCLLFHARMPFAWRKEREDEVLELFGKQSGKNGAIPRPKTLLVATQVVEQSLDLDADFMASELAPVDLILQRMGRLYRHKRARTTTEPCFALLCDVADEEAIPDLGVSAYIYAPHTLLRSWLALRDILRGEKHIVLPRDIEPLVQSVYDASDPSGLSESWIKILQEQQNKLENQKQKQKIHAGNVSVPLPRLNDSLEDWLNRQKPDLKDDDDPQLNEKLKALTRDGEPSITAICCGTDADGHDLAPDMKGKIPLNKVIEMMQFSLPLSNKHLYYPLVQDTPPDNWKDDAHLRYCRRIVFDRGAATVGEKRLMLTKEKGLEIEGGVQAEAEE